MFGHFDRAQLQRGFLVYKEVCSACHSLSQVSYRNLSQPGGPELSAEQVKAIAAEYTVMDGPNEEGEMFERPASALLTSLPARSPTGKRPWQPTAVPIRRTCR